MFKYLSSSSDNGFVGFDIPTAQPLMCEPDASFKPRKRCHVADEDTIGAAQAAAASQGKA